MHRHRSFLRLDRLQAHTAHQPAPVTLLQICLPSSELSSSITNCLGQLMFNAKWCKRRHELMQ